jgi:hypothetical protein
MISTSWYTHHTTAGYSSLVIFKFPAMNNTNMTGIKNFRGGETPANATTISLMWQQIFEKLVTFLASYFSGIQTEIPYLVAHLVITEHEHANNCFLCVKISATAAVQNFLMQYVTNFGVV